MFGKEEVHAELIRQIKQPSDILRRYIGETIWKQAIKFAGEPNPRWLAVEKDEWREKMKEFLTCEEALAEITELVNKRYDAAMKSIPFVPKAGRPKKITPGPKNRYSGPPDLIEQIGIER